MAKLLDIYIMNEKIISTAIYFISPELLSRRTDVKSVKIGAESAQSGLREDLSALICLGYQMKEEKQPFPFNIFTNSLVRCRKKNLHARESEIF